MYQFVDNGFFAKYFEGKSWSTVTQNKWQETTSANMVGKLSARVPDLAHLDVLMEWLQCCQIPDAVFRHRPSQLALPQPAAQQHE